MNTNAFYIGVGIDTARYGHHVSFLDEGKRSAAKSFHFKEGSDGYQEVRQALDKLRAKHPNVKFLVRIDAAGQYAENLIHWIHKQKDLALSISVGTPLKNKRYREAHYDKRKADPIESLACARFAVVERPQPMPAPDAAFGALRNTVSALEACATNLTRLVNQLHMLLALSFPEFAVIISDISKGYALKILEKYPTAKRLGNAKIDSLVQIPHLTEQVASKLHESAKTSTAHASDLVQEALIKAKVREIMAAKAQYADLLKILKNAWDSLPNGPHRRIHTIKGIGLQTAASLVAKMVSIGRFKSDSCLIGYFGIFPEETDTSGTHRDGTPKTATSFRMSRKGNDLVRRLLYTAAQSAARHNPAVRALYARQAAMGKPYNLIMGHCMAKLLRQVYAVWAKDEDFDPAYELRAQQELLGNENVVGPKVVKLPSKEVTTTDPSLVTAPVPRKPLNFAVLKSQIPIVDVLRSHGWIAHTSKGHQLRGPCLIHQAESTDRSFAVHTAKNTFCCHSCGCQGNAIDLIVAISKQPLLEAVWNWIEQAGIEPTLLEKQTEKRKAVKQAIA